MQGFFGDIEIAQQANQGGENAPRFGTVDGIHRCARILCGHFVHPDSLNRIVRDANRALECVCIEQASSRWLKSPASGAYTGPYTPPFPLNKTYHKRIQCLSDLAQSMHRKTEANNVFNNRIQIVIAENCRVVRDRPLPFKLEYEESCVVEAFPWTIQI